MPEVQGDRLDVSAEEERYLKRAFRRFALPWLIAAFAAGAFAGALPQWIEAKPEPAAAPELRAEQGGSQRSDLAALSERVVGAETALANMRDRLALLESQSGGSGATSASLEQRFDAFGSRIATLESQVEALRATAPADAPAELAQ